MEKESIVREKERIIRNEAIYFCNRNLLSISTDRRAIEQFRLLKKRLIDFYPPENKAIFLDQAERMVNEKFAEHKAEKNDGQFDPDSWYDRYFETLLFYIHQELETLPALARLKQPNSANSVRDQVFISFSPADKSHLEDIKVHFKPFKNQIKFWDSDQVLPGQKWQEEIQAAINKSKVIILLFSADFLASEFIISKEMSAFLNAAEIDGAVILSVILRPCLYDMIDELERYKKMNPGNVPVLSMDNIEKEELYVNLVRQTKRILDEK